jgi:hypothetical protein
LHLTLYEYQNTGIASVKLEDVLGQIRSNCCYFADKPFLSMWSLDDLSIPPPSERLQGLSTASIHSTGA